MSTTTEPTTAAPWLVADIGGTHARFALITAPASDPVQVRILRCGDYPNLVAAVEDYLSRITEFARPVMACVAVAGPICGDTVRLTNAAWEFSITHSAVQLGLHHLELVNDFTALALAVPQLPTSAYVAIGPGVRWPDEPIAVIGPGTGLGVAGLLRSSERWLPVSGEGGHAGLPVETEQEAEVARVLRKQHDIVCAETVLSGPGLARLHRALCAVHGVSAESLLPEQICERARHGADTMSRQTVAMFCGMLGTFAGNVALTFGARGGVLLGGGVLPGIANLFAASTFRERFVGTRAIAGYLDTVATELIVASTPALLGAAARLAQHAPLQESA